MISRVMLNIAEEAGSSLYEWLNIYKTSEAAVFKNRGMRMCGYEM